MAYIVRQQSAFVMLDEDEHRFKTVATQIQLRTCATYDEARALVYTTFADSNFESHYAVVSQGGRFVKDFRIGSLIKGFRNPGEITDVA